MKEKILKCSSVELQLGFPWQHMDAESGKKVAIGWCCALLGYHHKVTLSQGHCKVKLAKNMTFRIFCRFQTQLGCRWLLQMTVVDTLLVGCHFTTHRKGFVCNFSLGGDYHLGIPLTHTFPKAGVNQQNYWNVAVSNRSLSPHDDISVDTELVMKGGMNWCCALLGVSPQGHLKVISRSLEGQTDKTWIFGVFNLFQSHLGWRWVLQMTAVETLLVGYYFTTHRKGFVCHLSLGERLPPLVYPLSHPFPNVIVNQQNC